jgi:hypothetical protein
VIGSRGSKARREFGKSFGQPRLTGRQPAQGDEDIGNPSEDVNESLHSVPPEAGWR